MEVILLEKIRKLGVLGDQVRVKPGYGRNFLIPQNKAVYATADNIAKFEAVRAQLEQAEAQKLQLAEEKRAALLAIDTINIPAKVGKEGKLFGSIGAKEIIEAISQNGVILQKSEVRLQSGALRQIGEYTIDVVLHTDVRITVPINIIPVE